MTTAASPSPNDRPARSRIDARMRGRLTSALASAVGAMRSKVASLRRLAICRPMSIRAVALPEETLLRYEADGAAQPGQRLLLEGRGLIGLRRRVVDRDVQRIVAFEVFLHTVLSLLSRRSVRHLAGGIPARSTSARCGSGRSKLAMISPSISVASITLRGWTGNPRKVVPPAGANTPTGSSPHSFSVRYAS